MLNLHLLRKKMINLIYIRSHIYYTQCQLQMAVTNLERTYFVVWTRHDMIIDTVTLHKELWDDIKYKFILCYENFHLKTFFVK